MLYFLLRVAEKNGRGSSSARMAELLSAPVSLTMPTSDHVIQGFERTPAMDDKPQAECWQQFLELRSKTMGVSEQALLHDLTFALQGVEGSLIRFNEQTAAMAIALTNKIPEPVRQLVNKIAECGTFCYHIRRAMSHHHPGGMGVIKQSLLRAAEVELREYLKVVACFEETVGVNGKEGHMMTLRKALLWFSEYIPRLSFLHTILIESRDLSGGAIITAIHRYLSHGHPQVSEMASRLLNEVLHPFFGTLIEFVRYGNLQDPFNEFFIRKHPDGESSSSEKWTTTWTIQDALLPAVITRKFAEKVMLTGKTRSFLSTLGSSMEVEEQFDDLINSRPADVIALVERECQLACQQISQLLVEKYALRTHLKAIRDFMHFGRGDFACALIEFSSGHLSKPAASMFRHALVSCLDQALLSLPKNAAPVDIRDRMDVRLHETTNPKCTGWDVFTLDYKVEAPLDIILSTVAMSQHANISHFLWSLRRVYFTMQGCWNRVQQMQRTIRNNREFIVDMKRLQLFLLEATSFSRQICDYAMGVTHKCWDRLFTELEKSEAQAGGLDYFIAAHDRLLDNVRNDLFIFYNGSIKSKLAAALGTLLKSETVIRSYEHFVALQTEHDRRQSNTTSSRHLSGSWSIAAEDEAIIHSFSAHQMRLLAERRASFQHAARQFQSELDELLLQLQKETGESSLTLLLDYSGYHRRRAGFDQKKYCAPLK